MINFYEWALKRYRISFQNWGESFTFSSKQYKMASEEVEQKVQIFLTYLIQKK